MLFLYNVLPGHDFGIAIIIFTVILKTIQIPVSKKQIESQKKMQEFQPKIKELKNKYKNDKERQTKETMKLYKENHINPLSGCLPIIVQMVFLFIIYRVIYNISKSGFIVDPNDIYRFVENPGQINNMFLGFIDLSRSIDIKNITLSSIPTIILVIISAIFQYFQTKMMMAKQLITANKSNNMDFAQIMSKQMLFIGPLMTLYIGTILPAGLALYWLISTLFAIGQQMYMEKKLPFFQKPLNTIIVPKK
ncbi:MAG: YidC/Oxa1 family membrane protein insertase [bacterium]|nr:YidC/Oxa1 family membrane protein insertase [bacterium]